MTLRNKRVYIVEDNEDNIYVLLRLLRKHGASVQIDWWAKGEREKVLKALPIDVILLDLMLPQGRSGFDVFDELRTIAELDDVPIVAVSAADVSVAMPVAEEKGFAGYISKPVDFELFPQQIAAIIDGDEVWAGE